MTESTLNIHAHLPGPQVSPFIKAYIVVESQHEWLSHVLPDTSVVMALRFRGNLHSESNGIKIDLPLSSISGLRKTSRTFQYSGHTGNILIIFKEAGLNAFFKAPVHELFGKNVSLDHFMKAGQVADFEEQLAAMRSSQQRIDLVERLLISQLQNYTCDPIILNSLHQLHQSKGSIRIRQLADSLYMSQDVFEKRFRRTVGTSPKQFSSILRLRNIVHVRHHHQSLSDIAFNAGYFDQAHFNKDFKLFTGQTPGDFFRSPPFLQVNDFLQ